MTPHYLRLTTAFNSKFLSRSRERAAEAWVQVSETIPCGWGFDRQCESSIRVLALERGH